MQNKIQGHEEKASYLCLRLEWTRMWQCWNSLGPLTPQPVSIGMGHKLNVQADLCPHNILLNLVLHSDSYKIS